MLDVRVRIGEYSREIIFVLTVAAVHSPIYCVLVYFISGRSQICSSLCFEWNLVFGLHQQVSVLEQLCKVFDGLRCD